MISTIDTLINARWIIPIEPANTCLEHHSIAVHEQRIIAILPSSDAKNRYQAKECINLDAHILMPGLINSHGHSAMTLLRGFADDTPLMQWLEEHIWPAEGQFVSAEFVQDGAQLAMAEMIRTGTTCFQDMYFFPQQVAEQAHKIGMRASINFPVFDFPSAWGSGPDDYIQKGLSLLDDFKHSQYIDIGFGPHAPYTVSDEPLQRIATLAAELDLPVQMHVHETEFEVSSATADQGQRPLQRLADLGLLGPRFQCVHMTQIDDQDLQLLQQYQAHIIHCPKSNLKLASGFCPTQKLLDAGINVALGTDGAASNNTLDMFSEINIAALLAKAVDNNASALNAYQALRMATLNGAIALGREEDIGSLVPGKQADIIAINTDSIAASPMYHPASHLVYANNGQAVSDVWIAGKRQLRNGELCELNSLDIKSKAQQWRDKIRASQS